MKITVDRVTKAPAVVISAVYDVRGEPRRSAISIAAAGAAESDDALIAKVKPLFAEWARAAMEDEAEAAQ